MESRLDEVMTATIGRIVKYDPTKQVADVLPVILRPYNIGGGEVDHEQLPVLPNVPLLFPRAGGFVLHLPIAVGDHVLLVFCHDSIGIWREKGSITEPGELQRHSLANAVAIAGIAPGKPLSMTDPTEVAARATSLVLGKDGGAAQIQIGSDAIKLGHGATEPVALAQPIVDFITAAKAWMAAASRLHREGPRAAHRRGEDGAVRPARHDGERSDRCSDGCESNARESEVITERNMHHAHDTR